MGHFKVTGGENISIIHFETLVQEHIRNFFFSSKENNCSLAQWEGLSGCTDIGGAVARPDWGLY